MGRSFLLKLPKCLRQNSRVAEPTQGKAFISAESGIIYHLLQTVYNVAVTDKGDS